MRDSLVQMRGDWWIGKMNKEKKRKGREGPQPLNLESWRNEWYTTQGSIAINWMSCLT